MDPDPSQSAELFRSFDASLILPFILLGVLLILSALISGSEVAFFSLRPSDKESLREGEHPSDALVLGLLQSPEKLLASILISNNFVNIGIVLFSSLISERIFNFQYHPIAGLLINMVGITFLILLFGEILPKVYATANSLPFARFMARPTRFAMKLASPIIFLLVRTSKLFDSPKKQNGLSMDDLEQALELTDSDATSEDEQKILKGIVRFGSTTVRQIMKPRTDVVAFDIDEPYSDIRNKVIESGYSRIPVYEESFDNIKGTLYIKDLLGHIEADDQFAWIDLIRPAYFVPESKKIDDLLKDFQNKKMHMAVVVDEFGGTSGIVTLEDVIEEIVGDISDEFDIDELVYSKLDEHTYVFEGKTVISDFCKVVNESPDRFEKAKGDSESLAGFILELAGKFPEKGEEVRFENILFTVESIEERRILRVKVQIEQPIQEIHEGDD